MKIGRRATLALAASALAAGDAIAQAPRGGEPRIGMTLNDIPATCGAPDQGGEGIRWMGFTIYDSLVYWNPGQEETIPRIVPALAESFAPKRETRRIRARRAGAAIPARPG
jgi:ABC-type transport system substrate-binding protein